ncbi:neurofilament medium polypeptide-like [Ananas comosus]|uniref:Neurofilament medium polypeptide-like n=2 Tax=Ananas comosus TaxID=4615 RepID=A0A6P5EVT1_ANACO|nr:neurofilament medium polypeptide-like [Ananas comosus]
MGGCTSRPAEAAGPHPETPSAVDSAVPEIEVKTVEGGDAQTEAEAAKADESQLVDHSEPKPEEPNSPAATTGEELKPESSAVVPEKLEDKEDAPKNEVAKESKEEEKRSQVVDHPLAAATEGSKTS